MQINFLSMIYSTNNEGTQTSQMVPFGSVYEIGPFFNVDFLLNTAPYFEKELEIVYCA